MKRSLLFVLTALVTNNVIAQSDSSYYTVRLSSFEVGITNNTPNLKFKTVCFLDYARFAIEVSEDGYNYKTVNTFTADKLRCQQPFDFTDNVTKATGKLFYRVNVGNIDGKYYHSGVRLIVKGEGSGTGLQIYPTVVSSTVNFALNNNSNDNMTVAIRSVNGTLISSKVVRGNNGTQTFSLPVYNLQKGIYFLQVIDAQRQSYISKFIKQ